MAPVEPGAPDLGAARERLEALLEGARGAGVACLVEVHDAPGDGGGARARAPR